MYKLTVYTVLALCLGCTGGNPQPRAATETHHVAGSALPPSTSPANAYYERPSGGFFVAETKAQEPSVITDLKGVPDGTRGIVTWNHAVYGPQKMTYDFKENTAVLETALNTTSVRVTTKFLENSVRDYRQVVITTGPDQSVTLNENDGSLETVIAGPLQHLSGKLPSADARNLFTAYTAMFDAALVVSTWEADKLRTGWKEDLEKKAQAQYNALFGISPGAP